MLIICLGSCKVPSEEPVFITNENPRSQPDDIFVYQVE
jgi:hypothetical protein